MSTDNNREKLFPDVTEHYGPEQIPTDDTRASDALDFAIPTEKLTDTDAVVAEHDFEPIEDTHGRTDRTEDPTILNSLDWCLEPATAHERAPKKAEEERFPDSCRDHQTHEPAAGVDEEQTAADVGEQLPDDPYASAPDWVRAHIPRGPLEMTARTRGFKSSLGRRRPSRPAADSPAVAPLPSAPLVAQPEPVAAHSGEKTSRTQGKGLMLFGAAAATVAVIAAGVVTAITGNDTGAVAPSLPEPATVATTTVETTTAAPAVAAPPWCEAINEPARVVGNGAGGRDTGPAVIQAFEHAYYTQRDGVSVAALMLIPSPAAEIQGFIDAVPVGTEHCTTVLPTEDPNRWSVDVLLKFPPLGTEGVHRQWITTASADGGLKIATVEDRK